MARFDVHANRGASRERMPYLVDVQSDLLAALRTRIVVPLARPEVTGLRSADRLMPTLEVADEALILLTPQLAGISSSELGPAVASLAADRGAIIDALDVLVSGV